MSSTPTARTSEALNLIIRLLPVSPGHHYSSGGMPRNAALTDRAALSVTVQVVPETESHPVQPVNSEPSAGVAVRVTTVL